MKFAKKSLGQNFLVDKNILKKITNLINISNKNILEIGPGTGNLTKYILEKKPKKLILIEKDKNLFLELKNKFKDYLNTTIINDDILKFNLDKNTSNKSIIFGNLPYNISSQILVKLIKSNTWPPNYNYLLLMFQKEVADKIVAKFKSKNYGRLSILCHSRLEILKRFEVSKNCFFPKPKVESTLILFKPKTKNKITLNKIETLEKITNIFFSQKRKMINKSLKKIFTNYTEVADKYKIDLTSRPSDLDEETYMFLADAFEKL